MEEEEEEGGGGGWVVPWELSNSTNFIPLFAEREDERGKAETALKRSFNLEEKGGLSSSLSSLLTSVDFGERESEREREAKSRFGHIQTYIFCFGRIEVFEFKMID